MAPVSLDRISVELELSKSSASVAARLLEKHTLVRRHGERGSKRVFYSVSNNFAGMLREQMAEYYAKATGACKGKGGPMHITHPETGVISYGRPIQDIVPMAERLAQEGISV